MNRRRIDAAVHIDAEPKTMQRVPTHAGFEAMNKALKARALKARAEAPKTKD